MDTSADPNPLIDPQPPAMAVRRVGSLHVGGRAASLHGLPERQIRFSPGGPMVSIDPNGDFEIEQMYVQYVQLQQPRSRYPLLLMHGGGMCGVCYETKPDGRDGWQSFFLRAGHDVWVADAVERGRASWARSPEFFVGEAVFRTKQEAWELFRIGPPGSWQTDAEQRRAHTNTRFPWAAFDQFMKQSIPRWASNDAAIEAAYVELARMQGPFVLIAHSQGCNFAFAMALAHPQRIKAIVAVEPSGFPQRPAAELAALRHIPHLMIWGDHLSSHPVWQQLRPKLAGYRDRLREQGVTVDEWDLPAEGLHGNSHMIMMDDNSDEVAQRIDRWLAQQDLRGP
jgi:pimeloyl-ACP methyl ester carboxylesterase